MITVQADIQFLLRRLLPLHLLVRRNFSRKALYVIARSAVNAHAGTIYSGLGDKHANTNPPDPPIEAVEGILSTQLIVCYLARACTEVFHGCPTPIST